MRRWANRLAHALGQVVCDRFELSQRTSCALDIDPIIEYFSIKCVASVFTTLCVQVTKLVETFCRHGHAYDRNPHHKSLYTLFHLQSSNAAKGRIFARKSFAVQVQLSIHSCCLHLWLLAVTVHVVLAAIVGIMYFMATTVTHSHLVRRPAWSGAMAYRSINLHLIESIGIATCLAIVADYQTVKVRD